MCNYKTIGLILLSCILCLLCYESPWFRTKYKWEQYEITDNGI